VRALHLRSLAAAMAVAVVSTAAIAQQPERIDEAALARIRDEGLNRSQVMTIASWLTDVYGPRLQGSPNMRKAADWTVQQMRGWGMTNTVVQNYGEFGRGWELQRFHAQVLDPTPFTVTAMPGAWSEGTIGTQVGEVVYVGTPQSLDEVEKLRGTLRGKWVMATAVQDTFTNNFRPNAQRHTPEALETMTREWQSYRAPAPAAAGAAGAPGGGRAGGAAAGGAAGGRAGGPGGQSPAAALAELIQREGVLGVLRTDNRGTDGTLFVSTAAGASRAMPQPGAPRNPPQIYLIREHYNRIARTVQKGLPVRMEINAQVRFLDSDADRQGYNVLGEIAGSDPRLRDQVVMLGGHFDSWHGGTGATDNAAGSAIMLEAVRILKALNLPLKRTVRVGLWGGEEQGLLGSRAYVRQTFMDTVRNQPNEAHARFQAYFNIDNGGGAVRGIYLQQNDPLGQIFQQWFAPLAEWGPFGINRGNTGGTDHQSFDGAGLPGFQFVQDGLDYSTRTHHSTMDTYEKLIPGDMKRNAVILAWFAYNAANRDELLPRKPVATPAGMGPGAVRQR
jgi:carboxypeptidase Q